MKSITRVAVGGALALSLVACEAGEAKDTKSASGTPPPTAFDDDPYPSTYRPYPGTPTAIVGATLFDGAGGRIDNAVIFMSGGKIRSVGGPDTPVPADIAVFDGTGKYVTPGIIDVHSHMGNYPAPGVSPHSDGNEATGPATPNVWTEHSVWPQDPSFTRALANGGITTFQVLPGSANLFGGRSVTLKNVLGRRVQDMKFPGAPYGLKMACGENPKRVYGDKGGPQTRMGNIAVTRETWIAAQEYDADWDKYEAGDGDMPGRDLAMDTLRGVLDGDIRIHNHCYRADEMSLMMQMAKEFGYRVTSFQHAVEAYKIADLLRENDVCAAMWADWYGFKMESYDGIVENIPYVHAAGACAIVHSDSADGIQRLNQEAAKALAAGRRQGLQITDAEAWQWLSANPAKSLGIYDKTGSLEEGKMADVVLWNGNPYSIYTRPEKVWIDGALLYESSNPTLRPVTDFELGQPGEGDVK
ncbi:amidohydrolase [Sphingomicrobium clamense]|uniref:Amidohydrolase n=1 Tax=Sphingomicrobium clamense TaxID=2851013 RepID=A0ABS6V6Y0_9SPHN|nr:amidohydrolase [Sphingomicrobium sp. B8]MBW0145324.1 amidohydrolase [Sphingomicrobium sp. B8]